MRNCSLSWGSKNTLDSQGSLSVAKLHERVGNTLPELALSFSRRGAVAFDIDIRATHMTAAR